MQGPDELLVREAGAEGGSGEGPAGDNLVAHHLEAVEDGDGVGRELHPPVLLVPHVGAGAALLTCDWSVSLILSSDWSAGATLLTQDPELSQGQPVHQ